MWVDRWCLSVRLNYDGVDWNTFLRVAERHVRPRHVSGRTRKRKPRACWRKRWKRWKRWKRRAWWARKRTGYTNGEHNKRKGKRTSKKGKGNEPRQKRKRRRR